MTRPTRAHHPCLSKSQLLRVKSCDFESNPKHLPHAPNQMHRTKSTGRLIAKKFGNTLDRVNWNGHKQERGARRAPPDLRWPALDNTTKTIGQSISVGCLAMPVECEVPPNRPAPQEVYFIKSGCDALRMPNSKSKQISKMTVFIFLLMKNTI